MFGQIWKSVWVKEFPSLSHGHYKEKKLSSLHLTTFYFSCSSKSGNTGNTIFSHYLPIQINICISFLMCVFGGRFLLKWRKHTCYETALQVFHHSDNFINDEVGWFCWYFYILMRMQITLEIIFKTLPMICFLTDYYQVYLWIYLSPKYLKVKFQRIKFWYKIQKIIEYMLEKNKFYIWCNR